MKGYSTRQVAKKLGLGEATLSRYIAAKKIPAPQAIQAGDMQIRLWTDEDVEKAREILPKIANGRKTRHRKKAKKTGKAK